MTCHLCDAAAADLFSAIDAEWLPSYYALDRHGTWREIPHPVCAECVEDSLVEALDGEMVLASDAKGKPPA